MSELLFIPCVIMSLMKDKKRYRSGKRKKIVLQMVFCLQNAKARHGYVKYSALMPKKNPATYSERQFAA